MPYDEKHKESMARCAERIAARGEMCVECGESPRYRTYRTCQPCYYKLNREKLNEQSRRHNQKLRDDCFAGYGGRCNCCGENNPLFLTLDHVNRNGSEERRAMNHKSNLQTYRTAIKEGFPDRYQLLCFNCNCGRERNNGICPHQTTD